MPETAQATIEPERPAADERSGTVYVQRIRLSFDFPVHFTRDSLNPGNTTLADAIARLETARRHRVFVVVDEGVWSRTPGLRHTLERYFGRHSDRIEMVTAPECVPGGEQAKNDPGLVEALQRKFFESGMDRQSCVVIIGGGAVQDMAGYAAATTHRGLRVVRIPTTVASQNDSGVGVKNGINAFNVKNFVGTFAPPFAVINDLAFLDTLSDRDRRAGISEAVKVALIRDEAFFERLCRQHAELALFEPEATASMIRRGAELHLEHIASAGDPFETGSAKPLDFGHWAAHKLESLSGYRLRHGEAVAIGMAIDCRYAVEIGLLDESVLLRICALLESLGLELWHDILAERDATGRLWVMDGIHEFREHLGGELTISMITSPGRPVDIHIIDEAAMERSIEWLRQRSAAT